MRISAISSYSGLNNRVCGVRNNDAATDVTKPQVYDSISFKSYKSVFKRVDVSKIETAIEAENLFYQLKNSLIEEKLLDAGKSDILGRNLSEAFRNIKDLFKTLKQDTYQYHPSNGKTYIELGEEEIFFFQPYKGETGYVICFENHSSDFNPNSLEISKSYPSGNTYFMRFWKSTGNRKAFCDPAGNRNCYYKKDGSPDWLQNFFFGSY